MELNREGLKADLSIIGNSYIKKDVEEKVRGEAKFAADINMPNMLYGGVFRSTVPHATIKSLDISEALKVSGVKSILTSKDIPGKNRIGIIIKDEPVLVDDKIRRIGDAIAIVAAETEEQVNVALSKIKIEYNELEAVTSIEQAAKEDSPKVIGETNLIQKRHLEHGNVDEAFKKCDVIIENDYETSMYSHMFIEPDACIAYVDGGFVYVEASTQNPHFDRNEVAAVLGLPANKVSVKQAVTGGGFGGKLDISCQCHAALLSWYTKRPVKFVRKRIESNSVSSKRHPMWLKYKTGATKDGKIQACEITLLGDSGAYQSYCPAVITRAVVHAAGPYYVPNCKIDARFYATNNPMTGAFRGFGVPQVAVAHEGQMNALAKALNMDPIEIRKINAHREGTETVTGQKLDNNVSFIKCLDELQKKRDEVLKDCKATGEGKKRAFGYGCMYYGVGNTGLPNPAGAFVEVLSDATVNLLVGCADIGQGSTTVMAQIAAETLGLEYEDVRVTFANTLFTPEGGATSASRQTFISGTATMNACNMAKDILKGVAAEVLNVKESELTFKGREIYKTDDKNIKMTYKELMGEMGKRGKLAIGSGQYNPKTTGFADNMQGVPFEVYSYAATLVDLEVDTNTGLVDVKNVISAHDVGTAVNKSSVEGQIEGGVAMGLGFSLLEKVEVKNCKITNPEFSKYLIQTAADMPNIYPIVVEGNGYAGAYGAKGVGEPALIPTIPAAMDAVNKALGTSFKKTPITHLDIMREYYKK